MSEVPVELDAAIRRILAKHCGRPGHVLMRLDFGPGSALSVRIETPLSATRGEWETILCGETKQPLGS